MPGHELELAPAVGLRGLARAVRQISRLATQSPATTAFMAHRASADRQMGRIPPWVPLGDVSPFVVCAAIGAEDPTFFRHRGFWWHRVRVAVIGALLTRTPVRGVSTITQQLARNLFLTPERSAGRKLREALLAHLLERALPKSRILELYLNVVEWGEGIWGIGSAAREYCGRAPSELDAFESIVLVSLLPAPRRPLVEENARRALAVQRRLPKFLYAAGVLSLSQERELIRRAGRLQHALDARMTLREALERIRSASPALAVDSAPTATIQTVLASECGWRDRLRFEQLLARARENPEGLRTRPEWWADADLPRPGDTAHAPARPST